MLEPVIEQVLAPKVEGSSDLSGLTPFEITLPRNWRSASAMMASCRRKVVTRGAGGVLMTIFLGKLGRGLLAQARLWFTSSFAALAESPMSYDIGHWIQGRRYPGCGRTRFQPL